MHLAIFDLDNTLIGGDSDHLWGEFLVDQKLVDPEAFKEANDAFYNDYKSGNLNITAYLEFALSPLSKFSSNTLQKLHAQFMSEKITPIWLPKAQALVEKHRQAGDILLVITATNRFITAPIVKKFGIPNLLASEAEIVNGLYTGKTIDTPCFQEGKITRLKTWLKDNKLSPERSYFYSDSFNDVPLLERVEHPIAVDPDQTLQNIAKERGWPIMSLR